jgi:hypothetical protein
MDCLSRCNQIMNAKKLKCESYIPNISNAEFKYYEESYETMRKAHIAQELYHIKRELKDV